MNLWAFGVSPHGLGLTPEAFWSLTDEEYEALKEVHDNSVRRWAIQMSAYYNVHFLERRKDGTPIDPPWEPADFMGGDRAGKVRRGRQTAADKMLVKRLNQQLMMMRPGVEPEGLPEWAKGPYAGRIWDKETRSYRNG